MVLILFLGVVLYFGWRVTTPESRLRMAQQLVANTRMAAAIAQRRHAERAPFREQLRARTPFAFVMPALAGLSLVIFVRMHGGTQDPSTLLAWGGSFGPRTTNGEWWRIVTSMFVHATTAQFLVNMIGLVTVGLILERYVGPLTFLALYLGGGAVAGVVNIWSRPVAVTTTASAPIFALYGLALSCSVWNLVHLRRRASQTEAETAAESTETAAAPIDDATLSLPINAFTRLALSGLLFVVYSFANDGLSMSAELAALVTGLAAGAFVTVRIYDVKPSPRRIGALAAATAVVTIAAAVPVRRIADVKPELEHVVALEQRTVTAFNAANERLIKGRMTPAALAQVIEHTILPDFESTDCRLKSLERVPTEQQPLVAKAEEYLQLRSQSWRLRADGLRKAGAIPDRDPRQADLVADTAWRVRAESQHRKYLATFGKAESTERASLEALKRISP